MKNIYNNLLKGSFLGVSILLGTAACSDDHFDIKEQPGNNGATTTIWKSIEANPDMSEVAEILKQARVMKDDKDKKATLTFAEWLDQPMEVTVWLPKNGTFNEERDSCLAKLRRVDSLAAHDSLSQSLKLMYQVSNQFVRNHIALFNPNGSAEKNQVRMLNSKLYTYDSEKCLFNNVSYDPQATTYNSNGTLYVLNGSSPFSYNIFDYMSSDAKFSSIYNIISDPSVDKNIFWPEGSTEGAMNEKGEIVYVDSVYRNSNDLLSRANALIKSEDSIYVAFIPTNHAWQETFETVKPLFAYGDKYNYDWEEDHFTKVDNFALKFTERQKDSLTNLNTSAAIIESMFFNPTSFKNIDKHDSASVINYILHADSLISTNGVVFYNSNPGHVNPMFLGLRPIKASNGYIFAYDNSRINPTYSFMQRREVRPGNILASLSHCKTERGRLDYLTIDNWQKDLVSGEVQDDCYHYFEMDGAPMMIRMRMNNLHSGHYRISAQMLPNRINRFNVRYKDGEPIEEEPKFDAVIYGDQSLVLSKALAREKDINKKGDVFSQDSVSNIVLFDDFFLEKSYSHLPSGYETFPILEISMSSSQKRKGKCDALSICKIIIEPIRE